MEAMTVLVMMIIGSTFSTSTAANIEHAKNDTTYEIKRKYEPKKEKKRFTILGYEVKKVKPK